MLPTRLIGHALAARVRARTQILRNADYWRANTARLQAQTLRSLLTRAGTTEFGRAHDFARLTRLTDNELWPAYRKAVPIADWYAFREPLGRMREGGEPGVLWPGVVRDFAQTSGTTAGDKFIPVSREMMRANYRASLDIFANLTNAGVTPPDLFAGRALFLGGSSDVTTNAHGVRTGDLSGLVTRLIRWPLSEIYLPGKRIALMSDWTSKIDAMASRCAHEDVRFLSGMPSWAGVLFERMLEITGAHCVRELWPNLRVFVHGGVRYTPFDARMRRLWSGDAGGDVPHRFELYPASEGFVAMQDGTPGAKDGPMRLCADLGSAFEFVPLGEIDSSDPPAFTPDAVQPGERYVVVLTTCAGLWRYVLGDVVEFDTIPDALGAKGGTGAATVRIVGRHRHFINAFGENIIVEHIEHAVAEAARASGATVGEFTAAPVYPAPGRPAGLELIAEFEHGAPTAFAREFDEAIKAHNVDYTTKRRGDLGMGLPTITPVPMGTFHAWLDSRGKLGGQHKCPRCANHREYADALRALAGLDAPRTPSEAVHA